MKKIFAAVCLILLLAFFLRAFRVTEIPPSLNWDEVSIGYNAYSISKTGRDEWNRSFPVHFKSYGEYKLPAQIYASVPGVAIFGLNELGVRITPVVYGTLTVLFLFFLAKAIFQSNLVGLLSAFLLAISPWHIHLTRASFESSFSVMWVVLGMWFLVKGFKDPNWLVWSMIPFAISVYTYNSARVFTPLFLGLVFLIYCSNLLQFKKKIIASLVLFTLLMVPLVPFVLSGEGSARYKLVSITDEVGLIPRINENRGNSTLPEPLPRLVHNKVTYISTYFVKNYLAHFNPDYLFISGAPHKQHHVQNVGQLYLFQAPFVLLGIYFLIKKKQKFAVLVMAWILVSFIPVATTRDSIPHALRTILAAPAFQIITAYGIFTALVWLKEKRTTWLLPAYALGALIVCVSLIYYLNQYYIVYASSYSRDWQYGNKQVVEYIRDHQDEYDQIVFTRHYGEPHMFTLFYLNYDPAKFQNSPNLERFETYDWIRVLRFDEYYFASNGEPKKVSLHFPDLGDQGTYFEDIVSQNPAQKLLFIGKSGDFPADLPKLATINFLNGQPAFEIVESR